MTKFEENKHARNKDGRFAQKHTAPPSQGFNALGGAVPGRADESPNNSTRYSQAQDSTIAMDLESGDLSDEELNELSLPHNPVFVRGILASSGYPDAGVRASHDENPVVRALAVGAWDLTDADSDRLQQDKEAMAAYSILTAS